MRISTSTGRSCRSAVKVFCGKIKISSDYRAHNTVCRLHRRTVLEPAQCSDAFEASRNLLKQERPCSFEGSQKHATAIGEPRLFKERFQMTLNLHRNPPAAETHSAFVLCESLT